MAGRRAFGWAIVVACVAACPAPILATDFRGVIGAEPLEVGAPKGCYVYPEYVAVSQDTPGVEMILTVKKRRDKGDEKVGALCRPDGPGVLLRKVFGPGDCFYGIARDVLFIRQMGSGSVDSLILERLSTAPKSWGITASTLEAPRVVGDELQLLVGVESKDPACPAELYLSELGRRECAERAHAQWACIKAGAGKRLAGAADPFESVDFSEREPGNYCQLQVYEVLRVNLKGFKMKPTGRVKATAYFRPVD